MKKFLCRFTNKDKLSYVMNIAFGLCLLMITLQFQFGKTIITTPDAIIKMDTGYITESSQIVRIIEGMISIGLIVLGVKGLIKTKIKRIIDEL